MEAYFIEVLSMLVRWLHMIAGIAWIGASFYFVMLDSSLRRPKKQSDIDGGVHGELWAVHGGGFYHSQKYLLGPTQEPLSQDLHWSKWEAYTTWLSGIGMLALIYWHGADIYLVDSSVMALSSSLAIVISILFLAGGWLVYDLLCRSALSKNDTLLGAILFVLVGLSAWGLCHIFSGRGAYMIFGAMLGTIMVANVFFLIIPGQRKMVDSIRKGEPVDPRHGQIGKQRSVHNTYFTLPVLFVMMSNHYAMTYGATYNWLVLIAISLAGALIRVFFVSRHGEGKPKYVTAVIGVAILLLLIFALKPGPISKAKLDKGAAQVTITRVKTITDNRCLACHSASPTQAGFIAPPKGIVFDSADDVMLNSKLIYQQAVATKAMPLANLTKMTDAERDTIGTWYLQNLTKP